MVSLELLSSLDGLVWLQSGIELGKLFQEHQTTVSRNQKKCSQIFGITLTKFKCKWEVKGDASLLKLERKIHQIARMKGMCRLRLEVGSYFDMPLNNQLSQNWLLGKSNNHNEMHHIKCLRDHIIDACLCPLNKLPTEAQDLEVIRLKTGNDIGFIVLKKNSNLGGIADIINVLIQS